MNLWKTPARDDSDGEASEARGAAKAGFICWLARRAEDGGYQEGKRLPRNVVESECQCPGGKGAAECSR